MSKFLTSRPLIYGWTLTNITVANRLGQETPTDSTTSDATLEKDLEARLHFVWTTYFQGSKVSAKKRLKILVSQEGF